MPQSDKKRQQSKERKNMLLATLKNFTYFSTVLVFSFKHIYLLSPWFYRVLEPLKLFFKRTRYFKRISHPLFKCKRTKFHKLFINLKAIMKGVRRAPSPSVGHLRHYYHYKLSVALFWAWQVWAISITTSKYYIVIC